MKSLGRVVATRILEILERDGRTIKWLADQTGIPSPTLRTRLMRKPEFITLAEVILIAEALDVDVNLLVAIPAA